MNNTNKIQFKLCNRKQFLQNCILGRLTGSSFKGNQSFMKNSTILLNVDDNGTSVIANSIE